MARHQQRGGHCSKKSDNKLLSPVSSSSSSSFQSSSSSSDSSIVLPKRRLAIKPRRYTSDDDDNVVVVENKRQKRGRQPYKVNNNKNKKIKKNLKFIDEEEEESEIEDEPDDDDNESDQEEEEEEKVDDDKSDESEEEEEAVTSDSDDESVSDVDDEEEEEEEDEEEEEKYAINTKKKGSKNTKQQQKQKTRKKVTNKVVKVAKKDRSKKSKAKEPQETNKRKRKKNVKKQKVTSSSISSPTAPTSTLTPQPPPPGRSWRKTSQSYQVLSGVEPPDQPLTKWDAIEHACAYFYENYVKNHSEPFNPKQMYHYRIRFEMRSSMEEYMPESELERARADIVMLNRQLLALHTMSEATHETEQKLLQLKARIFADPNGVGSNWSTAKQLQKLYQQAMLQAAEASNLSHQVAQTVRVLSDRTKVKIGNFVGSSGGGHIGGSGGGGGNSSSYRSGRNWSRGELIQCLHEAARDLPLFISVKPNEPAPPLCGAIPPLPDYVIPNQDLVAAQANEEDNLWILSIVVHHCDQTDTYELDDIDEDQTERRTVVPRNRLIPLPTSRPDPEIHPEAIFPMGTDVLGLYPQTTCFYRAIVFLPPRNAFEPYYLMFEDNDYREGWSPPSPVKPLFVVRAPPPAAADVLSAGNSGNSKEANSTSNAHSAQQRSKWQRSQPRRVSKKATGKGRKSSSSHKKRLAKGRKKKGLKRRR